jgi:hypothetical protein
MPASAGAAAAIRDAASRACSRRRGRLCLVKGAQGLTSRPNAFKQKPRGGMSNSKRRGDRRRRAHGPGHGEASPSGQLPRDGLRHRMRTALAAGHGAAVRHTGVLGKSVIS